MKTEVRSKWDIIFDRTFRFNGSELLILFVFVVEVLVAARLSSRVFHGPDASVPWYVWFLALVLPAVLYLAGKIFVEYTAYKKDHVFNLQHAATYGRMDVAALIQTGAHSKFIASRPACFDDKEKRGLPAGLTLREDLAVLRLYSEKGPTTALLEKMFRTHRDRWRAETRSESDLANILQHWDYQSIINMGLWVVPLILEDLKTGGGHWGWALQVITGENACADFSPEDCRCHSKIRDAWLAWGRRKGYVTE